MREVLLKLLQEHTIGKILCPKSTLHNQPVLAFLETDNVGFALEQLAAEGLVSALVLQSAAKPDGRDDKHRIFRNISMHDVLGFVDLNVILHHLLRGLFETTTVHYDASSLEKAAVRFCQVAVGELLKDAVSEPAFHGQISNDKVLKCDTSAPVLKVIKECFLCQRPGGSMRPPKLPAKCIHHVSVYTPPTHAHGQPDANAAPAATLFGIVSQSDLIRFLAKHEDQVPGLFHKSIKDLGLVGYTPAEIPPSPSTTSSETSDYPGKNHGACRVTLVPASVTALEAFRRMCMHRDSGVGALRDDGTLRVALSARDLRNIAPGQFHALLMRVDEFVDKRPLLRTPQPETGKDSESEAEAPPAKRSRPTRMAGVLTCQATSSLSEIVSLMATHNAHRIYVVDPDSKPLGAVTMADVLRVVVDYVTAPPRAESSRDASRLDSPAVVAAMSLRRSSRLESGTSVQSDCAASACTSEQSERPVVSPTMLNRRLSKTPDASAKPPADAPAKDPQTDQNASNDR